MIGRSWRLLLMFALCGSGCASCLGESGSGKAGGGFTPCLSYPPPAEGQWKVGPLAVTVEERQISLKGTGQREGEPLKLAVFSGPAPGPGMGRLGELATHEIDFALCLGGLGDDAASVSANLKQLAALPLLVLVLPGGRDDPALLTKSWEALSPEEQSGVLLLTGIELVRLPGHEFVVVSGSEEGQYARHSTACGYEAEALEGLAAGLSPPNAALHRGLWAWMAPGGGGAFAVGRTHLGLDVGSQALADFAQAIDARSGFFAWPAVRAAQPAMIDGSQPVGLMAPEGGLRLVSPRLGTFPLVRSDGSRVPPGFVILSLGPRGIRLVGRVEVQSLESHLDKK